MLDTIRAQIDSRRSLAAALESRQGRVHPAFLALQRQLLACQVELTESVLHEARHLARCHPGLTVGQFARHLAASPAGHGYSLA